ncbi:unnamed protein product [Strongylus vulgaris]|uniref:Uncharacterized protein n=1 Tax=Strongylus vulgaris TaxID=40348 RepID=A0A3P7J708_STRVU|nr:unnamed protein product [Strongylus vulgaris]
MEGPGETAPSVARCVDVHGDEITDFDAEQLSEMDMMLYSGHLALGDLVLTSSFGEEVEYRVAVGTRHGSQIVLEKIKKSPTLSKSKGRSACNFLLSSSETISLDLKFVLRIFHNIVFLK